jgi:hypothetical protein
MSVLVTPQELADSAAKFRSDLLMMPIHALDTTLNHMSLRFGIRGKETVGQLGGNIQIGPYDPNREDNEPMTIKGRTLETFFGSVIKNFEPNSVAKSVYGDIALKGTGLTSTKISTLVLGYLSKIVSKEINKVIWSASHNTAGATTAELFDGFDSITTAEITAGNITIAKGNYMTMAAAITSTNAVDSLKTIFQKSYDELQGEPCKMFISKSVYNLYCEDYQASNGALPYNTTYKKTFLEGSDDLCELVALPNKKGSPYIHLTTKGNLLIGVDQISDVEKIDVEKHAAFVVQFVMAMFFGVQFETISPERLFVAKLFA